MAPETLALLTLLAGLLLAFLLGWLLWGAPLGRTRTELADRRAELSGLAAEAGAMRKQLALAEPAIARAAELEVALSAHRAAAEERDRAHAAQLAQLKGEFERLAGAALERAQAAFARQAEETLKTHRSEAEKGLAESRTALADLIAPMKQTLGQYGEALKSIEEKREQAYGSLSEQLKALARSEAAVREEAGRIVAALRGSARASGSWGEAQLRRVLELAGLSEGIDFSVQASGSDEDGTRKRPDAIIHLPGGRNLVVDSKCALDDHVAAVEAATDAERAEARRRHAQRLRAHARALSEKAYWEQFENAPDFVLMFVPGENFLAAALEEDPDLHLWAMGRKVLLVGPTNLLAIARVVAMVWRQEKMADEARAIGDLGAELYERIAVMAGRMNRVGKNLDDTARAWNAFVGSVEGRVLVTGRKLAELGADRKGEALPAARTVETTLRLVQADEARTRKDG
ncbi:MAG: DNA recombination protein RmuC [Sphingomonadaceae bacterium]